MACPAGSYLALVGRRCPHAELREEGVAQGRASRGHRRSEKRRAAARATVEEKRRQTMRATLTALTEAGVIRVHVLRRHELVDKRRLAHARVAQHHHLKR